MTVAAELDAELKTAIKGRDQAVSNVIRQVQTEVALARTAPDFEGEVDDDLYLKTIASYIKKMGKAKREFEAAGDQGRAQADKLAFEIEYLSRWVEDEALDEDQTRAVVRETIARMGVDDPKQAGRVIGTIMKSDHQVDGSLVSRIVKEELGT